MTIARAVPAIVVDASAVVDVIDGDPTWVDRFREWQDTNALMLVPSHFGHEVANALLKGKGFEPADVISNLRRLFTAGIEVVDGGLLGLLDAIELAGNHHLTVYDAAYLSLVLDVDGELATNDKALIRAARAEGISVVS